MLPSLLSIIVPCFNEEENIVEVYNAIEKSCAEINHETIFVDDGSLDRTVLRVNELSEKDSSVSRGMYTDGKLTVGKKT
ncbi:MAG TPA: glycosyltransferase [Sulfurimonas sp.]|nr:glycosyltransferase [Sulfurimonas sp.]